MCENISAKTKNRKKKKLGGQETMKRERKYSLTLSLIFLKE